MEREPDAQLAAAHLAAYYSAGWEQVLRMVMAPASYQYGVMWTVDEEDLDVPGERLEWHDEERRSREVAALYPHTTVLVRRPVFLGTPVVAA